MFMHILDDEQVEVETLKVKKNQGSQGAANVATVKQTAQDFSVNAKFSMVSELAAYVLSIELQVC